MTDSWLSVTHSLTCINHTIHRHHIHLCPSFHLSIRGGLTHPYTTTTTTTTTTSIHGHLFSVAGGREQAEPVGHDAAGRGRPPRYVGGW